MAMTKKDFEILAKHLGQYFPKIEAQLTEEHLYAERMLNSLVSALKEINPKFSPSRFYSALACHYVKKHNAL
jgi:hypothetical protein